MIRSLTKFLDFSNLSRKQATLLILLVLSSSCRFAKTEAGPSIKFTRVPQTSSVNSDKLDIIQGRVDGARSGQQVVLYVRNGNWWLQPLSNAPFTKIETDSTWINSIHLGSEYAALLVDQGYRPEVEISSLPTPGQNVVAVALSRDFPSAFVASPTLQFSGYEWRIRNAPSDRGDRMNLYSPANAWTDANGALHLRIAKEGDKWTCAEVTLTRNLGYGKYSFVVRDSSGLGPRVTFSMFTWDYAGAEQNNREMSIEIGRAGGPEEKNAQYVVQPFHVAANVARFAAPADEVTHSFRWEPGKLSFRSVRGLLSEPGGKVVGEHVFTSGVPSPGVESVRMAIYIFGNTEYSGQTGAEVVIDKFEYVP